MASCVFPKNTLLIAGSYNGTTLTLTMCKGKATQTRKYMDVPQDVAYPLLYKKTGSEVMSYYSTVIREHYKVEVL